MIEAHGDTEFCSCFEEIEGEINSENNIDEFTILFLSDGLTFNKEAALESLWSLVNTAKSKKKSV